MILIINESDGECKGYRQKLATHFESQCLCHDYATAKRLRDIAPRIIIMTRAKDDEIMLKTLKAAHKAAPSVRIILYDQSGAGIPEDAHSFITLLAADFGSLADGIRTFEAESMEWEKRIREVERYIKENIKKIRTAGDIPRELHLESRQFNDEFKYCTGKNLTQYVNSERLELITKILRETPLKGANYYAIARECRFGLGSSLYNFVRRNTGMKLSEFHFSILEKKGEAGSGELNSHSQ